MLGLNGADQRVSWAAGLEICGVTFRGVLVVDDEGCAHPGVGFCLLCQVVGRLNSAAPPGQMQFALLVTFFSRLTLEFFENHQHSLKILISKAMPVFQCNLNGFYWNLLTFTAGQSTLKCRAIFHKSDQGTVFQVEINIHFCTWKTCTSVLWCGWKFICRTARTDASLHWKCKKICILKLWEAFPSCGLGEGRRRDPKSCLCHFFIS